MENVFLEVQPVRLFRTITIVGLMGLSPYCDAQISVDNFQLTASSVSFDIQGTMPATPPGSAQFALMFSNPSILQSPGFVLEDFVWAQAISFSDSRYLLNPVATGGAQYGDYFYLFFASDESGTARSLLPGETINGSLVAQWSHPVFDPSAVSQLNVYWGTDTPISLANTGVELTTIQVPEPASVSIFGLGLLVGSWIALQRRSFASRVSAGGVAGLPSR